MQSTGKDEFEYLQVEFDRRGIWIELLLDRIHELEKQLWKVEELQAEGKKIPEIPARIVDEMSHTIATGHIMYAVFVRTVSTLDKLFPPNTRRQKLLISTMMALMNIKTRNRTR